MAVDATRRWPCLPRRMSPRASVNGQAPRRRPRPARPRGPVTAYGCRSGPCEALRTPLSSTDALGSLFTRRVASQRRVSTAKALAEPLLDRCKPLLGAGGAVLGRCRPLQALFQAFLGSIPPQTPRFRRFRLQRPHTFLNRTYALCRILVGSSLRITYAATYAIYMYKLPPDGLHLRLRARADGLQTCHQRLGSYSYGGVPLPLHFLSRYTYVQAGCALWPGISLSLCS